MPLAWLLEHGSLPVQVRALTELVGPADDTRAALGGAYAHPPAVRLALQQRRDGTWGGQMLSVARAGDASFEGIGTIPAVRRLLEYGWEQDAPTFHAARKVLFRLLAEDLDPYYLYELRADAGTDEYLIRRGRALLREAAAATLAQLGCEADPRLRGAAVRLLDRVMAFVRATASAAGAETAPPLPANAAPPTPHFLVMLAYMPRFRSEHQDEMTRLLAFLSAPAAGDKPRGGAARRDLGQPQVVLGDPLAGVSETTGLPSMLAWLEVMARLGFLRRNPAWSALLDRLLNERDAKGVWQGRTTALAPPERAWDWPTFPLGDPAAARESLVADMTFRLAMIARLAGRTLEPA
ncbi:hypothetical protein J421_4444 [Gemmatirosa kalamazoonensis]|uniref:Uncharacterized protein n=1 Tax=Gemmatirosa kalamazoonensis TaxID=861299 RepID=W0RMI2_9BACT|nr:hypothetical protein [Gemmatirosa kalamazoonensis]AHG91981.1 hypothetical protein J421_4444 [Gemmatirosa kalamazoonensis]